MTHWKEGFIVEKTIKRIDRTRDIAPKRKHVAAYARVSSGKDAMLHSLSEQASYYSALIRQNHR
jgi:site-specific DNA recombinase